MNYVKIEQKIDLDSFTKLDSNDLKEMGLKIGPRKKILDIIDQIENYVISNASTSNNTNTLNLNLVNKENSSSISLDKIIEEASSISNTENQQNADTNIISVQILESNSENFESGISNKTQPSTDLENNTLINKPTCSSLQESSTLSSTINIRATIAYSDVSIFFYKK